MNRNHLCCQNLMPGKSPFQVISILYYYDGPVSGIMICQNCLKAYSFEMLDWNDRHDVRVFSLALLSQETLADYNKIDSQLPSGQLPPNFDREVSYRKLRSILDQAQNIEWIIVWHQFKNEILAVRQVTTDEYHNIHAWLPEDSEKPPTDWFAYIGLNRDTI